MTTIVRYGIHRKTTIVRYGIHRKEFERIPGTTVQWFLDAMGRPWQVPKGHVMYCRDNAGDEVQLSPFDLLEDGVEYWLDRAGKGSMVPPSPNDATEALRTRVAELEGEIVTLRAERDAALLGLERDRIRETKEFFS